MNAPEKKRLFAAIFPSLGVVESLSAAIARFSKQIPAKAIRWTAPNQIHLTLNFLGAIEVSRMVEFEAALQSVSAQVPAHNLRVAGLGCFPSEKRARIVWAGLSGDLEPLQKLKQALDGALAKLGYVPETRPFHPHLTLGRVAELRSRESLTLHREIRSSEWSDFGQWAARQVDLVQSFLSPKGASYAVLKSFPLIGA